MNEMTRIAAQPEYSAIVRKLLAREPALFIDGQWVKSSGGATIPVFDAYTELKTVAIAL